MKILLACEESQIVCKEFRKLGHEAYSNDIQECSGGHPEWHLQMDVFEAIKLKQWGLMIAFPPCTYLSNAGIAYFNEKKWGEKAKARKIKRLEALDVVKRIYNSPIEKICIENPVGYLNLNFMKPSQIIHPYYFGDRDFKRTCLWLKNLPKLIHVKEDDLFYSKTHTEIPQPDVINIRKPSANFKGGEIKPRYFVGGKSPRDGKYLSKTFPGIAKAMAEQWGGIKD